MSLISRALMPSDLFFLLKFVDQCREPEWLVLPTEFENELILYLPGLCGLVSRL